MKRISNARLGLAVCALAIGLGACGPSQDQLIQTAIAKTQAAATSTPAPTPTLSPERLYVQEVTPVLAALDSLSNTSGEFSTFINTNAADLMFCEGMARSSGPWLCPLTNAASAEALVLTQRITDSGFEVKSLIEAITPPASLRTSHTQIRACIDYEIDRATLINSLIVRGVATDIANKNACTLYKNAIDKVKAFVAQYK